MSSLHGVRRLALGPSHQPDHWEAGATVGPEVADVFGELGGQLDVVGFGGGVVVKRSPTGTDDHPRQRVQAAVIANPAVSPLVPPTAKPAGMLRNHGTRNSS